MNKRSLWTFSLMLSAFVILNTFILDTGPKQAKSQESIIDMSVDHLPMTELKNSVGHTICSSLSVGDLFITLSGDNLPKTLLNNGEQVHKIKKTKDGINIYSSKISPTLKNPTPLKEGDEFLVVTNLSANEPKLYPAIYRDSKAEFLLDTPDMDGLMVSESKEGLSLSGIWHEANASVSLTEEINGFETFFAATQSFSRSRESEKYYTLQNDDMQVVFSTRGGAIAEMNLKMRSKDDPESVVYPVRIDREMVKQSPQNSKFPLHESYIVDESEKVTLETPEQGGYMPLLRRDIISADGKTIFKVPAQHYALALKKKDSPRVSTFHVTKFTKDFIQFKGQVDGKDVVRSYCLDKDAPYTLDVKNSVNGHIPGLVMTSGLMEEEVDSGSTVNSLLYYNDTGKKMKLSSFSLPKEADTAEDISPNWTASTNGFFGAILNSKGKNPSTITTVKISGKEAPSRVSLVDADLPLYPKEKYPAYEILTPVDNMGVLSSFTFYGGPLDKEVLTKVDEALSKDDKGSNPEFVKAITVRGWLTFISDPFAKFMNIILNFFYMITSSWGFSIILLTITLHLLLYPFSAKAFKSMIKMKKIGPRQKEIEAKYKKDPQRLRMELMMLYKNEGVNPLASILPMFLQIPFFIGMFDLLKTKFALRGVGFIPGWITNLTAPDVLFSWGFNIPLIGNEFHLLPILGALAMHFSQKFMTNMQGPKKNPTDMEKQMQSMGPIMTIVFLFIFYNLASGLNIYLIVSSLLRVLQQWHMTRKHGDKNPNVTVVKN